VQFENDNIDQTTGPTLDKLGNFYFTTRDDFYSIDYFGELRWIIRGLGSAGSPLISDNDDNVYLTKLLGGDIFSISKMGKLNWTIKLNCSEMITCSPAVSLDFKLIIVTINYGKSLLYFIE
jgi:outer membrane protein assembly factor BamB